MNNTNRNKYWLSIAILLLAINALISVVSVINLRERIAECERTIAQQKFEISDLQSQVLMITETVDTKNEVKESPWDFDYVARVVAEEAQGESFEGQMAVAQTIRERAKEYDMTPEEVTKQANQYATPTDDRVASDSVIEACERVFINGESVTAKPIKYFYSTVGGFVSDFHEQREFVMEIGNHRFFT